MPTNYLPHVVPIDVAFDAASYSARAMETYERRLYMEGGWWVRLRSFLAALLNDAALAAMPLPDASHNVMRDTVCRLAARYETAPELKEGDIGALDMVTLFSDHQTVEQYALAYNVAVLAMRVVDGELLVDVLPPDHCDTVRDRDGRVVKLRLARPARVQNGVADFSLEEWDTEARTYSVRENGAWRTVPGYPWVFSDGRPFIPVVLFRASKPPDWWGACRWPELIEATQEEGAAWTIHRYGRFNAANGTPYVLDAEPVGSVPDGSDAGSAGIVTGPNMVLQLVSRSGKTGSAGVLQATFDPQKDVEAIVAAYNARMASLGIGDNAVQRRGAESGLAIVVRREGLLRLRNATEPMFRRADQDFMRRAVALMRIFAGGPPESPRYRIEYAPVSMGSAENKEMRDQEKHDLDIKVATPASILARREGIALEEASARLVEMGLPPTPTPVSSGGEGGEGAPARRGPVAGSDVEIAGFTVHVEYAQGETRSGINPRGESWSVTMPAPYGEIRDIPGRDGSPVDAVIGPDPRAPSAFVASILDFEGQPDEDKVFLGFPDEADVRDVLLKLYPGLELVDGVRAVPVGQLRAVLESAEPSPEQQARGE